MKIKLEDIIEAIYFANDEITYYYDTETEKICFYDENSPEFADYIEKNYYKYILLPQKYEINDYNIMEEFICNLSETKVKNELSQAIYRKGAFRGFKDRVYRFGLEKAWFSYRDEQYKKIAEKWCRDNKIEFI